LNENMPCPSCGSHEVEEYIPMMADYPDFSAIRCIKCGMRGPVDAWNLRVPSPQLVDACAAVARLREVISGLLMVAPPSGLLGSAAIDNAIEALKATEKLPISYPINASTKSET